MPSSQGRERLPKPTVTGDEQRTEARPLASHVRGATAGTLRAEARPLHVGRTAIVYGVEVRNDGVLVSVVRCTIAVRAIRG